MLKKNVKNQIKLRRVRRTRINLKGSATKPRFSVFRSHKHIFAQLIDDEKEKTLLALSDRGLKGKKADKEGKIINRKEKIAYELGFLIAQKALEKKIEKVIFDRGGYKYHGRVKAMASGARAGGLKF